jgi:hypothetical protein
MVGFISLILGLIFLGLGLYLFPIVFLNINIDAPLILFKWITWLDIRYHLDESSALKLIWGSLTVIGLFLVLIADISSNYIDNQLLKLKRKYKPADYSEEHEKEMIEVKHMVMVLCIAILLVFGGVKLFEMNLLTSMSLRR